MARTESLCIELAPATSVIAELPFYLPIYVGAVSHCQERDCPPQASAQAGYAYADLICKRFSSGISMAKTGGSK